MKYMLTIDQSTSGTKGLLVDQGGYIREKLNISHAQNYPNPGWVEQDGEEIWQNVASLINQLCQKAAEQEDSHIVGLSIANQRETTLVWDRKTGQPLAPAVTWQCQRGAAICEELSSSSDLIRSRTGLELSAYYPAAKAAWLLQNIPGLIEKTKQNELCIGTVDSYLIFRLTDGEVFATDYSNASRTQLFNLDTLSWDQEIAGIFDIPVNSLPEIKPSDSIFGYTSSNKLKCKLPISGVMGDSHAALFGQGCFQAGMAKATYGTGSSIMLNIGSERVDPPKGIAHSIAWSWNGKVDYVLEGNVTSSGDTLKWLCDELELVQNVREIDDLAEQVESSDGVYLVPAFAGLGAPYFKSKAQAAILGLSRGSKKVHVARAALESIAYQNNAVINAMGVKLNELRVDGGPTRSRVLMQFQSDLLQCRIRTSIYQEISALGAAFMGGMTMKLYEDIEKIESMQQIGTIYDPEMSIEQIAKLKAGWNQAVDRIINDPQ